MSSRVRAFSFLPKAMRHIRATVLLAILSVAVSSCATTINLSAPTTLVQPSVTTLPTGTPTHLFGQLHSSIAELSVALTDQDTPRAKTTLATVLNIWQALQPQISAAGGTTVEQTVLDMQRIVDLASSSVERTRPADADKALRFLDLVIQSQH